MNNREIETLLAPINVRVVCADELSAFVKNRPQSFVVNTDRCGKPGRHWTAFHFPPKGPAEFFDSLGQTPDHYDVRFRKVLIANGPSYLHLVDRVQAWDSDVCGHFCVYFLLQRYRGRTMEAICGDFFKRRYHYNDALVRTFAHL